MGYLTESEIELMADAALVVLEFSGDREAAMRAAREYAVDDLGRRPRDSAVLLAYKRAHLQWQLIVQSHKRGRNDR